MYKSILVPIDLSEMEKGKVMIDVAQRLATDGTKVRLVNVVTDIPAYISA